MVFIVELHTDVGIRRSNNQDSLCVKEAETPQGNVLLAVICDGMGGLEKGEVASATVVRAFSAWFEQSLPASLAGPNTMEDVRYQWERLVKGLNQNIADYGRSQHIQLGSTLTAVLIFADGSYLIGHVGDTRAYEITNNSLRQLTFDQTVVANEVRSGRLTPEQALRDPRRNVLLQCIGASKVVEPDFLFGRFAGEACCLLCSDGFRHVITEQELQSAFSPANNLSQEAMKQHLTAVTEWNKQRQETDNISAILIRMR